MVSIKQPLISLILANLAMTSPLAHTVPRADNTTLPIKVPASVGIDCYINSATTLSFTERSLRANVVRFPDTTKASGFPHYYGNSEHFRWDYNKAACDAASLLEMPAFTDGRLYDWDSSDPRAYTGPVRAVYFADGGARTFCGLIAHRNDAGYFEKCTQA